MIDLLPDELVSYFYDNPQALHNITNIVYTYAEDGVTLLVETTEETFKAVAEKHVEALDIAHMFFVNQVKEKWPEHYYFTREIRKGDPCTEGGA